MSAIINEVPEGEYVVDIVEMKSTTDGKDRKVVRWTLVMVDGPFAGCVLLKKYYVINKKAEDFLKGELRIIGIEANSAEEFEAKKAEAYGKRIRITATTNDQGYRAYYVKEVIGKGEVPPAATTAKTGW
jgi:hypothetical protein